MKKPEFDSDRSGGGTGGGASRRAWFGPRGLGAMPLIIPGHWSTLCGESVCMCVGVCVWVGVIVPKIWGKPPHRHPHPPARTHSRARTHPHTPPRAYTPTHTDSDAPRREKREETAFFSIFVEKYGSNCLKPRAKYENSNRARHTVQSNYPETRAPRTCSA